MVRYALNEGKGIKKGEVVLVQARESSKPLYAAILREIWKAGGHVISRYAPDNDAWMKFDREFYQNASDDQLTFFPDKFLRGQIDQVDHLISILSTNDKESLRGVDSKKIMKASHAMKPYSDWFYEKVNAKKLSWTLCMYGTPAMAKHAGLTEKEFWGQIIKACYLDTADPVAEWRRTQKEVQAIQKKLDRMKIEKVHVESPDADLWITIGGNRAWKAGSGANIPSFEVFTSPDWRGTNGWIRFSEPLLRYGNRIEGIELEFKDGKVVRSSARKGEQILKDMIATKNADKLGEFSLTDRRFSKITKFMAETLFDENVGGKNGNTHVALGNAYRDCFVGDPSKIKENEWDRLGYNNSSVHTDIVSTAPRTVTAYFANGRSRVIYKNGQFTF